MRSANKEMDSLVIEQVMQARDILDGVLKHFSADVRPTKKAPQRPRQQKASADVDFSTPLRAFIKKYSGGMNGARKFTLVLAYLAKGSLEKEILLTDIERHWNRMTSKTLLGMKFNRFYTAQAKENDWADVAKQGTYHLRPNWKSIFS
jgi:hypothetical protein